MPGWGTQRWGVSRWGGDVLGGITVGEPSAVCAFRLTSSTSRPFAPWPLVSRVGVRVARVASARTLLGSSAAHNRSRIACGVSVGVN